MARRWWKGLLWGLALLALSSCVQPDSFGEPIRVTLTPYATITAPVVTIAVVTAPTIEAGMTSVPEMSQTVPFELPVGAGTPVPVKSDPILPETISEITELARWEMGFVNALVFSPDGDTLMVGLGDYWSGQPSFGVRVVDPNDGKLLLDTGLLGDISTAVHSGSVVGVDVSPDGTLLASAEEDGWLRLWRLPAGELIAEWENPGYLTGLLISPDCSTTSGCILAVGVNEPQQWGQVVLWQVADGDFLTLGGVPEQTGTLVEKYGRINSLRYSSDGKMLASGSKGIVRVWRVTDGAALLSLEENTAMVSALAFSPDGRLLAAGTERGDVSVWQLGEPRKAGFGNLLISLPKENDSVTGLQFSPEWQLLFVGYQSGVVQVWQMGGDQPLEPVYQTKEVGGRITSLAISPAGDLLVLGINDIYQSGGPVTVWGIPDGE